jgi:predicted RNA-binding protein with PIN domain
MPDPTLYLFDGYNVLHAVGARSRDELIDRLAGYVALRGARGVLVFDGAGAEVTHGPLEVRYASSADQLLERLAAAKRGSERVCLVSSDQAIRRTAGQEVGKRSAKEFAAELARAGPSVPPSGAPRTRIEDALDATTRDQLERWRRRRP